MFHCWTYSGRKLVLTLLPVAAPAVTGPAGNGFGHEYCGMPPDAGTAGLRNELVTANGPPVCRAAQRSNPLYTPYPPRITSEPLPVGRYAKPKRGSRRQFAFVRFAG